jgi:hypothetical protein
MTLRESMRTIILLLLRIVRNTKKPDRRKYNGRKLGAKDLKPRKRSKKK